MVKNTKFPPIKNLKKTARRILKAIRKKERIIIYGDADIDGATSVIILKETLNNLNYQPVALYFPNREKEGYGITVDGLKFLKKFAPALLIALDLGITNFKEVKMANKMGFEVIIIDHHEVLEKLPEASIIVDPKQPEDKYPFKGLATAGIVFKLSQILLKKINPLLEKNFLELTALATIADMMPKENENESFIIKGKESIENSFRPGLKVLFENPAIKNLESLDHKISKIISLLNVRQLEDNFPSAFRMLDASSEKEAKVLVEKFLVKAQERKEKIQEIIEKIESKIAFLPEKIIFEGASDWEVTFISSVASNLCHKYQKPVFIFKKMEKESQGTVRTPKNIDSVLLMKKCANHLISFGGHPQASGFRIKNENLEKFKNCLLKHL